MRSNTGDKVHQSRLGKKRGVVGVILRDERFLIIRRSKFVTAPRKLCLPGGTMEKGESEVDTLVREMQEELAIDVTPVRLCWRSVTPWGTTLAWWLATIPNHVVPVPETSEVEEYFWMTQEQIYFAKDVLPSLPAFVDACANGEIDLRGSGPEA
jgi:8-oxo-dGTP pyrophosphatase MutT (NUDIX family)